MGRGRGGARYPLRKAPTGFRTGNAAAASSLRGELWKFRRAREGVEITREEVRRAGERMREAIVADEGFLWV